MFCSTLLLKFSPPFCHIRSPERAAARSSAQPHSSSSPPPSPSLSVSARLYPLQLCLPVSKGAPVPEARLPSSRTPAPQPAAVVPQGSGSLLTAPTMATTATSTRFTDEYQLYEELGK